MKRILISLLLFGILNAVLVGGQWLLSLPDTFRISAIEKEISAVQKEITEIKIELQPLTAALRKDEGVLLELEAEIESITAKYPGGSLPPRIYENYSVKAEKYNLLVEEYTITLSKYKQLQEAYNTKIEQHNSLVSEQNSLAQKQDNIWVLIPTGLGRRH